MSASSTSAIRASSASSSSLSPMRSRATSDDARELAAASRRRSRPPLAPGARAEAAAGVRPRRASGAGTARAARRSRPGSAGSRDRAARRACEKISRTPPTCPSIRIGNPTPDERPSASATEARGNVGGERCSSHSASPDSATRPGSRAVESGDRARVISRKPSARTRRARTTSPAALPDRAASSSRRPSRAPRRRLQHPRDGGVDRSAADRIRVTACCELGSLLGAPAVGHLLDHGADAERLAVAVEHRVVARQPVPLRRRDRSASPPPSRARSPARRVSSTRRAIDSSAGARCGTTSANVRPSDPRTGAR